MGLKPLIDSLRDRLLAVMRSRAIKSILFSGTPILESIRLDRNDSGPVFTLFYKNGLMLSLGESGILDYQDDEFDEHVGPVSRAPRDREFLVLLHKIVLKSLLRYITTPRLDPRQRERAAEAASKLYLACELRPGAPASELEGPSWSPGSRASARSR
jgi:hypothetical protein